MGTRQYRRASSRARLSSRAQRLCCCLALGVLVLGAAPAKGFHSPGSAVSGITSGPDGNLWAAIWHRGAGLYRITPSGQISQVGAGGPEGPLTTGSDGSLWAAVESSGIARITPSGQVAFFAPPPPLFTYETDGMATGPDGDVWFTSGAVNGYNEEIRVSRITPSGQVTPFLVPLSLVPGLTHTTQNELAPREITAGAGVLWMLTERGLVRTTTEGQMSFLPIRATQANPTGIAFGSDGNLWTVYDALSPNSLQLRRITPSGEVTAIPVPGVHTSGDQAVGITSGPDGALWLADGSRILRVTTAGAVTELPTGLPSTDQAESITAGPDGNLWFTAGLVIGRITLSGSVTAFPLPGVTQLSPSVARPVLKCVVPSLRHKTLAQARRLLIRAHCKLGAVARPKRRGQRKLTVVRQRPSAKTLLPIWSRVSVTLGKAAAATAQAASAPKTAFQCEKRFKQAQSRQQCFSQLPGANCAHPLEAQKAGNTTRGEHRYFKVTFREKQAGEGSRQTYAYAPVKNVAICPHGVVFKVSMLGREHCERTHGEEICGDEYGIKDIIEPTTRAGGKFEASLPPSMNGYLVVKGYFIHPPWAQRR